MVILICVIVIVWCISSTIQQRRQKQRAQDLRTCPFCCEVVHAEASICRTCHMQLVPRRVLEALMPEQEAPPHRQSWWRLGVIGVGLGVLVVFSLAAHQLPPH